MAGAIRMVSLARGHDPRDFALFAFGGAGPLHAASLARELGIPTVLVPVRPGITNAIGCVVADLRHDYVRTLNKPLAGLAEGEMRQVLEAQIEEGRRTLAREGAAVAELVVLHRADMQFQGQSHLLAVEVPDASMSAAALRQAFEAAYWHRFGVELPEIGAVLVNLHTAVIGKRRPIDLAALVGERPAVLREAGRRRVWFAGGWQETPIFRRDALPLDASFAGPAVIEQLDATTVIGPGDRVRSDALGNLTVSIDAAGAGGGGRI
jgi:N-methylhydantoinase A